MPDQLNPEFAGLLSGVIAFILTLSLIKLLSPLGASLGLLSHRVSAENLNDRKPVIGGAAIFIAVLAVTLLSPILTETTSPSLFSGDVGMLYIYTTAWLVCIGHLDDRFQLPAWFRLGVEALTALVFCLSLDIKITNAGNIFGTGDVELPQALSLAAAVVYIVGISNAFNMLDGIDGLIASLASLLLLVCWVVVKVPLGLTGFIIMFSLLAFLVSNLDICNRIPVTYLGDGGSKPIGFFLACLLLASGSSQLSGSQLISPISSAFLIALPIFDMIYTIGRRMYEQRSPLAGDRGHIHHALQNAGLSPRLTLFVILTMYSCLSASGLVLDHFVVEEHLQFAIFVSCFFIFCAGRACFDAAFRP